MTPYNLRNANRERGQTLILFSFMVAVLLLVTMCVVDVGFFLHARQKAQQTADAAALAGAQELPDDPNQAQVIALDYIARNDLDPNETDVEFSCTSDTDNICQDGDGRYDTIRVTPHVTSPTFFGAVLTFIGEDGCWVEGCTAQASAAGCRGACGPIGTGPADIITVLDHSQSMSTTDLQSAKDAATAMYTDFLAQYQRIGLAVVPPVTPGDMCDTADEWDDPLVWLPGALTDTFQTSPHVLNSSSPPVNYTNCLDRANFSGGELNDYPLCSCQTHVGGALKAATDELAANGRDDVTWGIILLTDGASNVAPTITTTSTTTESGDTGFNSCSSNNAVTSSAGDNNGFQSNASSACSNGGSYAEDTNSGSGTSTSCSSTQKDKHRYYNFDLGSDIPNGVTINGIEVRLDAWTTGAPATRQMCVELSSDDGTTWTSVKTQNLTGSETSYYLGNSTDLWGRTWDDNDFDGNDFRIRITNVSNDTTADFRLDYLAAKVYYTETTSTTTTTFDNNLGPCDYTMTQAAAAKALGIEVYTIGYGLDPDETCADHEELPSSPYYNYTAEELMTAIATDAGHFYNAPLPGDLEGIFEAIGSELTVGSRLVE